MTPNNPFWVLHLFEICSESKWEASQRLQAGSELWAPSGPSASLVHGFRSFITYLKKSTNKCEAEFIQNRLFYNLCSIRLIHQDFLNADVFFFFCIMGFIYFVNP